PTDLSVSVVATEALVLDPRNARTHGRRNLEAIGASLSQFGQRRPLVVTGDMTVIAGNGTLEAARALGWTEIAVTVVPTDWTVDQARAYALADNRTAELAAWDEDVLLESLSELDLAGWDMDVLGFDLGDELAGVVEDEALEPPDEPVTRPGDVWALGEHRLLCGDATKEEDIARLMAGAKAACMWTDPPYGVDYVGKTKDAKRIANDGAQGLDALLRAAFTQAESALEPGSPFYVAHPAGPLSLTFGNALVASGLRIHQTLVWVKDSMVLGHSDYHYKHEPIYYGWSAGEGRSGRGEHEGSRWHGDNAQVSVLQYARPSRSEEHPTMKPVGLVAHCLSNSTGSGALVFDPFLGSGTTLIACEQLGRLCYGLELEAGYCDVVIARWQKLSGEKAVLLHGEG
ncbi:MAG TPA: site-specific DNA-methyltransferase, partial [Coriobacteriia bacterium]